MTLSIWRPVISTLSTGTPRRGSFRTRKMMTTMMKTTTTASNNTQTYMPFTSGTKSSSMDLRIITPPPVSSTRNAHSKPCFTLSSEKRALGVMTPEDVEKRIDRIMRLASDARLCIQDCREFIATEQYNEELHFAKLAVDATGVAYSELLEELALSPEGVEVLNEIRKLYAPVMESLKQELNKISKSKEDDD